MIHRDGLKAHIAKMKTIHGDEPIRIKIALPWALSLDAHMRFIEERLKCCRCRARIVETSR